MDWISGRFILAMPRGDAGDCGEGEEGLAVAGCGAVPPLVGSRLMDAVLTAGKGDLGGGSAFRSNLEGLEIQEVGGVAQKLRQRLRMRKDELLTKIYDPRGKVVDPSE